MLKITAWGKNKPVLPAVLAQIIAIAPQTLHKYLAVVRDFKDLKNISLPKSKLWRSFYLKNKHIQAEIIQKLLDLLVKDNQLTKHISDAASEIKEFSIKQKIITEDQLKLAKSSSIAPTLTIEQKLNDKIQTQSFVDAISTLSSEAHPISSLIFSHVINLIQSDIDDENNYQTVQEDDDHIIFTPEILFFLKIVFPCWIFYADNHTFLLRKARQGDLDSLNKILRLDKSLIADSLINQQLVESKSVDPIKFDLITHALHSNPKGNKKLSKIKNSLAGLISVISEEFGHRFTAPEIRELFNAVAIDYGYDEEIDKDLPRFEDSFNRAIQRERPFWKNCLL